MMSIGRLVDRSEGNEMLPAAFSNSRWTDPVKFSAQCAVALIGKRLEEKTYRLIRFQLGQTRLVQHQTRERLRVRPPELAKFLSALHNAADIALGERKNDGIIGRANRQQVLLGILQIPFQSGQFH